MSPRTIAFAALQLLLITGGVVWAAFRFESLEAEKLLPMPRNEPLNVDPLYDEPSIVSDEQLLNVLDKLKPRLRGPQPKINFVDHALRFWGVEAVFDDPECLSGLEMRELLLDHRRFAEAWGPKTEPFLIPDTRGVKVRTQEGDATASHVDHTLAGLAETGTPLDFPVITPTGETRLRAILVQSMRDFSLNQTEYEWSTLAYALYLPPVRRWFSTEGQEITFDRLADRIMRQRLAFGVCRGHHRLHALVMLLRIDEQQSILSPQGRARIVAYLQDVTRRLIDTQHADGYWDKQWPGLEPDGDSSDISDAEDPLSDRILVTGHVMEWWSLAPAEILPPLEVRVKAGQWLCRTIEEMPAARVKSGYPFLTHAGRALSLWRGQWPSKASGGRQPAVPKSL